MKFKPGDVLTHKVVEFDEERGTFLLIGPAALRDGEICRTYYTMLLLHGYDLDGNVENNYCFEWPSDLIESQFDLISNVLLDK